MSHCAVDGGRRHRAGLGGAGYLRHREGGRAEGDAGAHRLERRRGQLLRVGHGDELRRGEEVGDARDVGCGQGLAAQGGAGDLVLPRRLEQVRTVPVDPLLERDGVLPDGEQTEGVHGGPGGVERAHLHQALSGGRAGLPAARVG